MFTRCSLVLVLCFSFYHHFVWGASEDLTYAEKCQFNGSQSCDVGLSLYCNATKETDHGVCRCPNYMYWDSSRLIKTRPGACVSRYNETCLIHPTDGTPQQQCTRNAECRQISELVSRCECMSDFQANPNGECMATFNTSCSADLPCSYGAFLKCSTGICICDLQSSLQSWDPVQLQCISRVGGSCKPKYPDQRSCVRNSACSKELKCECENNFITNQENLCVVPYHGPCGSTEDCDKTLTCVADPNPTTTTTESTTTTNTTKVPPKSTNRLLNAYKRLPQDPPINENQGGHCMCDTANEMYNKTAKQCQILAQKSCPKNGKTCVGHSSCTDGLCTCDNNYLITGDRTCYGGHGAECKVSGTPCLKSAYLTCDNMTGQCICDKDYLYNGTTKVCVGHVGSPCKTNENCNATTTYCNTALWTCECSAGYTPYPSKAAFLQYCLPTIDTNCSLPNLPCNKDELLTCLNAKCACQSSMIQKFNYTSNKCMALAGGQCDESLGLVCVQNSTCSKTKNSNTNLCNCSPGFYKTDTNNCKKSGASQPLFSMSTILLSFILFLKVVISQ